MTFKNAALAIGAVIIAQIILSLTSAYDYFEWVDIPMHFAGGFAMALLACAIWQNSNVKGDEYGVIYFIFIIGFVSLIGIVWEWHEFILDIIFRTSFGSSVQIHQPGVADTMADFAMDILGGIAVWLFWRK
ncbi:hypothetical protein KJ766_02655 [Patescibacteria group bacterium]|nr:hypothetical protein [Patescibacteria group bacterium]